MMKLANNLEKQSPSTALALATTSTPALNRGQLIATATAGHNNTHLLHHNNLSLVEASFHPKRGSSGAISLVSYNTHNNLMEHKGEDDNNIVDVTNATSTPTAMGTDYARVIETQLDIPGVNKLAIMHHTNNNNNNNNENEVNLLNLKCLVKDKTLGLNRINTETMLDTTAHLNEVFHVHHHHQHQHQQQQPNNYYDRRVPASVITGGGSHATNQRSIVFVENKSDPNLDPIDGIVALLSAIYCKILVFIGLCFPMAEVISHRIPISWYEGFYIYLYMGSILFLIFVYIFLLNRKRKPFSRIRAFAASILNRNDSGNDLEQSASSISYDCDSEAAADSYDSSNPQAHCGSFYLRVGAVAFGVGSMIYSGLEFGQFFELESKEHCYSFIYGFTPGSHMIFTFIQLYFIFMNSRVLFARHKLIARFGLMHMIATNICVWLHVLIQETKHQIMIMVSPNTTEHIPDGDLTKAWDRVDDLVEDIYDDYADSMSVQPSFHKSSAAAATSVGPKKAIVNMTLTTAASVVKATFMGGGGHNQYPMGHLHRPTRSLNDHYITHGECRRSNIIGELVTDASQFLFPCTIEYSLICAAILYIMWKNISDMKKHQLSSAKVPATATTIMHHQRHHYQVDCAKAHKGLFTGIFLMVMCIISLILFFVFIKKQQYRNLAVLQAHIVELFIYCINAIACLVALFQVRELNYNRNRGVELDNILLIIAQSGLSIFTLFSIIGAQFISQQQNTRLVLINALACLIQATLQSVFILDASKRKASTGDQVRRKPGREMVTFLLVCNFSMWAINTLETRRADSNPVQMSFYGFWAWTVITHVTMPLTIFYRFHSTVCLCEIWKSTYKINHKVEY